MMTVSRWLREALNAAIARFPQCQARLPRCPQAGVSWASRAGHPLRHWLPALLPRCPQAGVSWGSRAGHPLCHRLLALLWRCPRLHICVAAFLLLLLLLLMSGSWVAAGAVTPRDPFAIPAQARCELQPAEKLAWQLQGVVGQPGDFHAWLVAAPATRLRLRAGEPLPGTRWQVVEIARLSVTLGADHGCPPPLRLALKERNHGQTIDPTAAAGISNGAQLPDAG